MVQKLQRILRIRRLIEKKRQRELALSEEVLLQQTEKLHALQRRRQEVRRRRNQLGRCTASSLSGYYEYDAALEERIRQQTDEVQRCVQERDEKRQQLLEATRQKRMLEKLLERQLETLRLQESRREQKLLDEVAARNWRYR